MGAPTRAGMTAGFALFGAGMGAYALALRSTLPGRAWAAALATGVATLGVAAFPLGSSAATEDAHAVFAFVGYATLAATPLLAARGEARRGRARWARCSMAAGVASGTLLLATLLGPVHGLFQRLGLTVGDLWVMASAGDLLRRQR